MSLQPLGKTDPFKKASFQVNNKLTRYARNAAIGLVAFAALGAIATLATHGGFVGMGSNAMIFAGAGGVIAGTAYLGLRFIRDRRQKNQAKKAFENLDKNVLLEQAKGLKNGSTKIDKVKLGKKLYTVKVEKSGGRVTKVSVRNR